MRRINWLGRIVSWLITALLAVLLTCNLYTIGVRCFTGAPQPAVFGWSWAVVISGSMEPEIQVNDMVIVHEEASYAVGDIITYESGDSVVTHRIVGETAEGYITKGDANNTEDMYPVPQTAVIGKVVRVIPEIGLVIQYLKTPLGMTCMVLLGFLLIEIPYLLDRRKNEKGGRNEYESNERS